MAKITIEYCNKYSSFDGTPVTAADLTGTGIITVFNDRFNGILQITSAVVA